MMPSPTSTSTNTLKWNILSLVYRPINIDASEKITNSQNGHETPAKMDGGKRLEGLSCEDRMLDVVVGCCNNVFSVCAVVV